VLVVFRRGRTIATSGSSRRVASATSATLNSARYDCVIQFSYDLRDLLEAAGFLVGEQDS